MKTESMRTRVKYCGLTRVGDIRLACELGVDAVGLVFVHGSPRCVQLEEARALRSGISPLVSLAVLFSDNPLEEIREVVRLLRPAVLQFHGAEEDAFCRSFGLPYIKAIPMASEHAPDFRALHGRYPHAAALLLDSHALGGQGGTGTSFDWQRIPTDNTKPIMVAGGLTSDNVHGLITTRAPWAVDVSSGIESAPGIKDGAKMHAFISEVHRADCENEHESGYRRPTPGSCG